MPLGAIILVDPMLPAEVLDDWKRAARDLSRDRLVSIRMMTGDEAALTTLASRLASQSTLWAEQSLEEGAPAPAAMTAAPFVYKDDGRPDWGTMWTAYCELALHGGPPHRGPDDPVVASAPSRPGPAGSEAVAEITRGILETTGLDSEPAGPGWLAITCQGARMAAWMCASIILENVDARCEDERLFVPADQSFELTDQVKSVVTVVSKTHHYWAAHMAAIEDVGQQAERGIHRDPIGSESGSYRGLLTEWGRARMRHDMASASRLHQRAHELILELSDSPAGRAEVEASLTDGDVWVRVSAASDVMRWAPALGRPVLDAIRLTGGEGSMDAAWALMRHDAGRLER